MAKASSFCLAFSVNKLLCAYLVPFVKFTTTIISACAQLGSHVTWDYSFIGRSYALPRDKWKYICVTVDLILSPIWVMRSCVWVSTHGRLNITRKFGPHRRLPSDVTSICLYGGCYIDPLKCGTWAHTWEWALPRTLRYSPYSAMQTFVTDQ